MKFENKNAEIEVYFDKENIYIINQVLSPKDYGYSFLLYFRRKFKRII